ncbi:hypothetical protein AcV5_008082 [Taiwanofungus camphoratus]|nr:hypothetical protein AcV5_008082 [Antrodia cinnamomea]
MTRLISDLQNVSSPDLAVRRALGDAVRDASINVGFLYGMGVRSCFGIADNSQNVPVKNHGISETTIEQALSASKDFFSLPIEKKMEACISIYLPVPSSYLPVQLDIRKTQNFKGYNPILSSNNDPKADGDMHEGFEFGWEELQARVNDEKRSNDGAMAGANVWPSNVPGFREAVLKYYHSAVQLGKKLFPLFALALDLPEDYFDDKTRNSAAIMRVLHYPPQTGPVDDRVVGIGAHTEYGTIYFRRNSY